MNRTGKKSIGNGFLAVIVVLIFTCGIATMLVSGYTMNPNSKKPEDTTSTNTATDPVADSTSGLPSNVIQPNAFEEESNLPEDMKLISVLNDDIYKGSLILVNYEHESRINGENLVNIYEKASDSYTVKNDDMLINSVVLNSINSFLDDFQQAQGSTNIFISSSYRSKADQVEIYNESVENTGEKSTAYYVSVPGFSEHQTGYCFDTATVNSMGETLELDGEGIYKWLIDNCSDYGLILRYPDNKTNITGIGYETWHFRYVGLPQAWFIKDKGLCLEEYVAGMQSYTYENGGLLITKDKKKWVSYYVPKLEAFNTTEVPVPKNANYVISGDNIGGFIVTVEVTDDANSSLLKNATDKWSFDNSALVIEGFKDYVPGEDDRDSDSDAFGDDSSENRGGDNRTDDWTSDSFWDEDDESQFDYVDYYDDYDDSYEDYDDSSNVN